MSRFSFYSGVVFVVLTLGIIGCVKQNLEKERKVLEYDILGAYIVVHGEIKDQGKVEFKEGLTLLSALQQRGGVTFYHGLIAVKRGEDYILVKLKDTEKFKLQCGDDVIVLKD